LRRQRLGGTLAFRDVAHDLRSADDVPARVADRRYRERDVEPAAVLRDAHGFEVLDALATPKRRKDAGLLVQPIPRQQDRNRAADDLALSIPEQTFSRRVERADDTAQVLAYNRVLGRVHDGRKEFAASFESWWRHM